MLAFEMLTEPVHTPAISISGVLVERTSDGNTCLTVYTTRDSAFGGQEHVIEGRYVLSPLVAHTFMKNMMQKNGFACCGAGRMNQRH